MKHHIIKVEKIQSGSDPNAYVATVELKHDGTGLHAGSVIMLALAPPRRKKTWLAAQLRSIDWAKLYADGHDHLVAHGAEPTSGHVITYADRAVMWEDGAPVVVKEN